MKRNLMILCLVLASMGLHAQRPGHRHRPQNDFTVEQKAALHSKRMTLALDLDEEQAAQVAELLSAQLKARSQALDSLQSPDGRFERITARMDAQIAFQRELQKVLSDTQYERWKKHQLRKRHKTRHGRGHGRR